MAREKGKGGRLYRHRLPEAGAVKKVREDEGHQERGAARQELKDVLSCSTCCSMVVRNAGTRAVARLYTALML